MEPEPPIQLEQILGHIAVGAAVLDCTDLRILYINPYLLSFLEEPWRSRGVVGRRLPEVVSEEIARPAVPLLQQVCATRQGVSYAEVPYEGFLTSRGRTYWRIAITPAEPAPTTVLVTVEDETDRVRSRLLLKALQHISSAIAGPFALPEVLDRILQAVQEMVGSTRCAILLLDHSMGDLDLGFPDIERPRAPAEASAAPSVTLAAQKGLHPSSQDWRPRLERLPLAQAVRERRALIIEDTRARPELELPLLNDKGGARRPGSLLCVPIFDPNPEQGARSEVEADERRPPAGSVLGTIEVYHRRARGFPAEEVDLLEQFAQQAALAIHNARLFLGIKRLAHTASRNVRQRENIMQAIPDGVIIYDARWRVAEANHAIRALLGWDDTVIGLPIAEAMERSRAHVEEQIPSGPDAIAQLERRALEHRVDELKISGADGRACVIRRSYAPIHDALGDIFAFVVVYHDITDEAAARERIEAEVVARTKELAQRNQALQEAKAALELEGARLQALLERLPSGVMLISGEEQRISLINRQAAYLLQRLGSQAARAAAPGELVPSLIGLSSEEFFNRIAVYGPGGELIPPDERPLQRALLRGEASEGELHVQLDDGQMLYLLSSAAPLRASDGSITGALLVWHDITHIKVLERVREDFFTTMAHELKTPLANIRAHLSALQARDLQWSLEEQLDFINTADGQVERLVGMINQFLDASRVEAGALRLELEPVLVPELFEDLQDRLEALIAASQRRLEIRVSPHLPAVMADYELIARVLINLLSNAFHYAPEGDAVLLEAEALPGNGRRGPREVEIRVSDNGPGLSREQQEELFTRFSTFAASRRPAADRPGQPAASKRQGNARWSPTTGLGLYISRGIIEAHQSTLTLRSSPGEGATFAFRLPVARARSAVAANGAHAEGGN